MKRVLIAAAALSVLLPGASMAQSDQQYKPGGRPEARPGAPGGGQPMPARQPPRPQPSRLPPPQARPGRPMQPVAPYRRPTYVQPLPPRGNQFWHRGQYYGRIHGPAFAYPPGWGYRQWLIGARLPALLFAPTYFYPGYAALGLQAPPPDYQWVRYGPDLLLVNLNTGEVEDVAYGVFM
jgi:hypothetical protein